MDSDLVGLTPLQDEPAARAALASGICVLYKHSPACATSTRALRQMRRFAREHPGTPVYMVDVLGQRPLARQLAGDLEVRHESPQAILLVQGRPVWHASHWAVTAGSLTRQIETLVGLRAEEPPPAVKPPAPGRAPPC